MLPDIICISFNKAPSSEDFPDAVLPTIIVNTPCQRNGTVRKINMLYNIVNICCLSRLTVCLHQKKIEFPYMYIVPLGIDN